MSSSPLEVDLRSFRSFGPKKKEYSSSRVPPGSMDRGDPRSATSGKDRAFVLVPSALSPEPGRNHDLAEENMASGDAFGLG